MNVENFLWYMANIQAVVFDLYGTLMYLAHETRPYARLFADIGLQTPQEWRRARRIALTNDFDNLAELVKKMRPDANLDLEQYEREIEKECESASLYPETIKVLDRLREQEIRLGLISNVASPYKKPFFDAGLGEYFDEVLFSCEVGLKKPNPEIYQKIVEGFRTDPEQILMTGDNVHADVIGPRSIRMNSVHLDRKNKSQGSIPSLEDIFQYL